MLLVLTLPPVLMLVVCRAMLHLSVRLKAVMVTTTMTTTLAHQLHACVHMRMPAL